MNESKIFERLGYALRKKDVENLTDFFSNRPNGVEELIELTTSANRTLGFHAAWVLEHIMVSQPEQQEKWLLFIIKKMPVTKNSSVKRHYAKIVKCALEQHVADDLILLKENTPVFEMLIETCFEWLIDVRTPISVKAYCMDVLAYLAPGNQWIKEELPHVVRLNMIDASQGIASKSKKILKILSSYEAS